MVLPLGDMVVRRVAKVDDNQPAIVELLRRMGASVGLTHTVGNGFPDLVVGTAGKNYLVEIKDGAKSPSRRKLTKDEEDFARDWRGDPPVVIETEDQAIAWLAGIRKAGL